MSVNKEKRKCPFTETSTPTRAVGRGLTLKTLANSEPGPNAEALANSSPGFALKPWELRTHI